MSQGKTAEEIAKEEFEAEQKIEAEAKEAEEKTDAEAKEAEAAKVEARKNMTPDELAVEEAKDKEEADKTAKEKADKTAKEEADALAAAEKPWWQKDGFTYTSEKEAVTSLKEQRKWSTKVATENAKAKKREDVFAKYAKGEIESSDLQDYLNEANAEAEKEISKKTEKETINLERANAAIEVGKIRHPEIVTDKNMLVLIALSKASTKTSPLDRLEDAVVEFKKIKGIDPVKMAQVAEIKERMKKEASNTELPGAKGGKEKDKDAWEMTDEEFRKKKEELTYGTP